MFGYLCSWARGGAQYETFCTKSEMKRQKFADVLADEEYSGIRTFVEELYPDRAHFIYELLQNAEDAGATTAQFRLRSDLLVFEHNGRPFSKDDVRNITNIGKSAKKHQQDKIGRFGIGFKAVFAYCETPESGRQHIHSRSLSSCCRPTSAPIRNSMAELVLIFRLTIQRRDGKSPTRRSKRASMNLLKRHFYFSRICNRFAGRLAKWYPVKCGELSIQKIISR